MVAMLVVSPSQSRVGCVQTNLLFRQNGIAKKRIHHPAQVGELSNTIVDLQEAQEKQLLHRLTLDLNFRTLFGSDRRQNLPIRSHDDLFRPLDDHAWRRRWVGRVVRFPKVSEFAFELGPLLRGEEWASCF